jgi:hypothetical protein
VEKTGGKKSRAAVPLKRFRKAADQLADLFTIY